jgi:MFS family permease
MRAGVRASVVSVTRLVPAASVLRLRDVRLIAGAVGLSALGDGLLWVLLALHVAESAGSALAVSALFVCLWAPVVALGGVAGRLVDRHENRRLLIVVSLAQAVVVAAMAASTGSPAVLLALAVLLGAGMAVSSPAEFALIPAAAGEERVAEANGHIEAARYLGMTAGPLLGGVLAAGGLIGAGLLLDAASFLAVAAGGAALHARREPRAAHRGVASPDVARGWDRQDEEAPAAVPAGGAARAQDAPVAVPAGGGTRAGLALLLADREMAIAFGAAIAALLFFTITVTAEVFFVRDVLDAGATAFGLLTAAWTSGMVAGAVGVARRVPKTWLAAGALVAVAAQGAGILGAAAGATLALALAGFLIGGTAHGVKNVLLRTLLHERTPEPLRGRAFAAYNAARNGAELGALAAAGVIVGVLGAQAALAIAGAVPLAIALVALALTARRRGASAPTTPARTTAYARA